jgi:hypothetical protein
LSYTTLSRICCKQQLYLLNPMFSRFFQVEQSIADEMFQLRHDSKCNIFILLLINYWEDNIILWSLNLHYDDVVADPNLMASNVLCLNKTQISFLGASVDLHAKLLIFKNFLSCCDGHWYNQVQKLYNFTFRCKIVISSSNANMWWAMNIITMYMPPNI